MEWLKERLQYSRENFWEMVLFVIGALVLSFAAMFIIAASKAQEIISGYGVVCDTVEQVEYYVMSDDSKGVASTNAHYGTPSVCGEGHISFYSGEEVKTVTSPKGRVVHIFQILWVGFHNGQGYVAITPVKQYTPFVDEEKGASLPVDLPVPLILVQHNHDEGHPDYQNWSSGRTSNCCNEKDCGDLDEYEVHETPTGTEVFVHAPGQPEKWCPVLKEHFIIKGKSPDWNKPHACIIQNGWHADECSRLMCYAAKGGV